MRMRTIPILAGVSPQRSDPDTPANLILHKEQSVVKLHHKVTRTLNLPECNLIARLVILLIAGHKWYGARMVHTYGIR